jgi:hypothetical protein
MPCKAHRNGGADGIRTRPRVYDSAETCANAHSCVESNPSKTTQQHDLAPSRTPVLEPYWNLGALDNQTSFLIDYYSSFYWWGEARVSSNVADIGLYTSQLVYALEHTPPVPQSCHE